MDTRFTWIEHSPTLKEEGINVQLVSSMTVVQNAYGVVVTR